MRIYPKRLYTVDRYPPLVRSFLTFPNTADPMLGSSRHIPQRKKKASIHPALKPFPHNAYENAPRFLVQSPPPPPSPTHRMNFVFARSWRRRVCVCGGGGGGGATTKRNATHAIVTRLSNIDIAFMKIPGKISIYIHTYIHNSTHRTCRFFVDRSCVAQARDGSCHSNHRCSRHPLALRCYVRPDFLAVFFFFYLGASRETKSLANAASRRDFFFSQRTANVKNKKLCRGKNELSYDNRRESLPRFFFAAQSNSYILGLTFHRL